MKAVIGLDAGHGGELSGTHSINSTKDGLFEKDYALELCLLIEEKLLANGFGAVLSRRTDVNPGKVDQRAKKMIDAKVDFALSVHFNGYKKESAYGCEVFVPHGEKYANIEANLLEVLNKYFAERKPFARSNNSYNSDDVFDKKMNVATKRFDAVSDKKAYFGFVRTCWEAGVSADLLEICFLTNKTDFEIYTKYTEEIADGIARAIVEGFGERYNYKEPEAERVKKKILIPLKERMHVKP